MIIWHSLSLAKIYLYLKNSAKSFATMKFFLSIEMYLVMVYGLNSCISDNTCLDTSIYQILT